jgi:glycosyltransferase involved in cell wall biosynthesis
MLKWSASKVSWLARRADQVIAGNDYLAEHVAAYNTNVDVVPSLIAVDDIALRDHTEGEELVLGWIGSASTASYLQGVLPILDELAAALAPLPVRLVVVGGHVQGARRVTVEHRDWSPQAERLVLGEMDVGIMPLPDNAWTRGKCAYKALQYMAAGVPVIADRVGVTGDVVGDGAAGYTLPTRSGWVDGLEALARDPALRSRLGAEGRSRVEQHYALSRWAPRIRDLWLG